MLTGMNDLDLQIWISLNQFFETGYFDEIRSGTDNDEDLFSQDDNV